MHCAECFDRLAKPPVVSDVGRLPEAGRLVKAAEYLEHREQRDAETAWRLRQYGTLEKGIAAQVLERRAAEDRATAALLRACQEEAEGRNVLDWPSPTIRPAIRLAAAVLGLPEDNERTANA